MRNLDTGNSRGFGFVTFTDPASVDKLLEVPEHTIDGKKLDIKIAVPRDEIGRSAEAVDPKTRRTCKIFTGGLALETTKTDLEEYFGKYGPIQEASVMVDRVSGRPRGFGFVVFQSEESVEQLLLEKHEIHGRKIDCKKAVPREETNSLPQPRGGAFRVPMAFGARNMFPVVPDRRGSFDERVRLPFDARNREAARAFDRFKEPERGGYDAYAPNSPPLKPMQLPPFANPYTAYQQQPAQPQQQQQQQSYQPTNYNTQSAYPSTSTPWEYAPQQQPAAAYGSPSGYPAADTYGQSQYSTSNAYTQPVGYGAARPAATSTPRDRYRPY